MKKSVKNSKNHAMHDRFEIKNNWLYDKESEDILNLSFVKSIYIKLEENNDYCIEIIIMGESNPWIIDFFSSYEQASECVKEIFNFIKQDAASTFTFAARERK